MSSSFPGITSLFLLLLLGQQMAAQSYHASTRRIGQADGLSNSRVMAFLSDTAGMWIGTQDGLNFFDGYEWRYWTKGKGHFRDGPVHFLLKDQAGYCWIFHNKKPTNRNRITSIDLLSPGRDSSFEVYQKPGAALPFRVEAIQHFFGDAQQRLYFVVDQEVWIYSEREQFRRLSLAPGFVPQHRFADGTFVGSWQQKVTLASARGSGWKYSITPSTVPPSRSWGHKSTFGSGRTANAV